MWPCSTLDNVARLMPLSLANSCWLQANASLCSLIHLANASARATISESDLLDRTPRARYRSPSAKSGLPSTVPYMPIPAGARIALSRVREHLFRDESHRCSGVTPGVERH